MRYVLVTNEDKDGKVIFNKIRENNKVLYQVYSFQHDISLFMDKEWVVNHIGSISNVGYKNGNLYPVVDRFEYALETYINLAVEYYNIAMPHPSIVFEHSATASVLQNSDVEMDKFDTINQLYDLIRKSDKKTKDRQKLSQIMSECSHLLGRYGFWNTGNSIRVCDEVIHRMFERYKEIYILKVPFNGEIQILITSDKKVYESELSKRIKGKKKCPYEEIRAIHDDCNFSWISEIHRQIKSKYDMRHIYLEDYVPVDKNNLRIY